ncbi:uncharacterized protein LOC108087764 [Drosophila ficusphila]|uniref:uncharacterized protein LOC108087764 n=1 Tax=Drosophila ficusphila TaxID=30025 RepID=UPI0007E5FA8D|nr:uncharacterized protein LOC108087764 [Drosophila ficusphila]
MLRKTISFVLFFSYLYRSVLCEPSYTYKLKNIECLTKPAYATNVSCLVKAINWNKAVAQMDVDLVQPLRNISVRLQYFKRDYSNQYQPFLVDVMIKFCDILSKRNFSPYGIMLLQVTKRFTNFNHSCPFSGHLLARNAYFDESFFPNLLPLGLYKTNITVWEGYAKRPNGHVGDIVWYMEVMPAYKKKNRTQTYPF